MRLLASPLFAALVLLAAQPARAGDSRGACPRRPPAAGAACRPRSHPCRIRGPRREGSGDSLCECVRDADTGAWGWSCHIDPRTIQSL